MSICSLCVLHRRLMLLDNRTIALDVMTRTNRIFATNKLTCFLLSTSRSTKKVAKRIPCICSIVERQVVDFNFMSKQMLVNHYRISLYQNARFFVIILLVICLGCGPFAMPNNVISVQYVINIYLCYDVQ